MKIFLVFFADPSYSLTMNNKNNSLNFSNVCGIRIYLAISIDREVKAHKETKRFWGVKSGMVKMSRNNIGDMIRAYRASKNIQIEY
jgi:hypothetical protein